MRVTITIDCDNAAFGETEDDRAAEVCRILQRYAAKLRETYSFDAAGYTVRDVNGNTVGEVSVRD